MEAYKRLSYIQTMVKPFSSQFLWQVFCEILDILMLSRKAVQREALNEYIMYIKGNLVYAYIIFVVIENVAKWEQVNKWS